jgi:hypothetical protein
MVVIEIIVVFFWILSAFTFVWSLLDLFLGSYYDKEKALPRVIVSSILLVILYNLPYEYWGLAETMN